MVFHLIESAMKENMKLSPPDKVGYRFSFFFFALFLKRMPAAAARDTDTDRL